ncbi:hypothetical protein BDW42DRAFT_170889 [Aspergillus taichungensis]|uniref:RRM domain-containing protein n=1 Tax=Aspergillus taichungensis TaxID=482145 RepID=A0A2J5HT47_9EURO|nr:hypothetical protein BDW42DRAFT_170889 [Aspergillus taichungensis]
MTPSSPDEALHFRGKTLTPESPRPLHVAEPASIPVLQNQMDPIFNDTSTYEQPPPDSFAPSNWNPQAQQNTTPSQGHHAGLGSVTTKDRVSETGLGGGQQPPPPPPQQQHQTKHLQDQGSSHIGSFCTAGGSATRRDDRVSVPSSQPAVSMESQNPSAAPAESSLTTYPPSDYAASHLAYPSPDVPPSSSSHITQGVSHANAVDPAVTTSWAIPSAPGRLDTQDTRQDARGEGGVDFQNLLDNLPASSAAPFAPAVSETAPMSAHEAEDATQSALGLPPRPPPQDKPSIHPNYHAGDDIRSYHQFQPPSSNVQPSQPTQQSNHPPPNAGLPGAAATGAPGTSAAASNLPPPPAPSFQQSLPAEDQTSRSPNHKNSREDRQVGRQSRGSGEDAPWGPEVQKKYDEFLHNERIYVTEGLWDRFPHGSRLFVGNLPTERVTKRDLFHIFHKYGKLAQISIKQAYGFIQFLESGSCKQALDVEQGAVVRGRKVHLEISKPQRNTRPGPAPAEPSRAPPPRRSRSPEYTRAGPGSRNPRGSGDRYERAYESGRLPFSDFRDEPTHRRRDDYRPPPRSPSPRPFRGRDGYRSRDRTPERYDRRERRRSRSPYARDRRFRSPSPRGRGPYEGDFELPVPRRAPRDVPEVQILVLEDVDRNFIFFVENAFRNRGLRVDVLVLGPRIPLNAAVQRQISEGVLAVVRLARPNQFSRKIPLQVFDRSAGVDNVRFNEYPDVEPNIAAEIVFHAQSLNRSAPPTPFPPPPPAFGVPPMAPAPIPSTLVPPVSMPPASIPALSNPANVANLITSLDGPTLQSLLSTLQTRPPAVPAAQPPFTAAPNVGGPSGTDLANILSAATRQPLPANPPQAVPPQQPFPLPPRNVPAVSDPNLLALLAKGLGGQPPQNQAPVGPHVQHFMNQLGKWKQ